DPSALLAAFDRIRVKEGADAVARPEARDGHLPADGGSWDRGIGGSKRHPRSPDPPIPRVAALRLLDPPRPIRVRLGRGGLEAFREGETWTDVTAWSGPDRVAPRWWRETSGARDYYIARAATGELWLLFRSGKQWCVEGWWD